jgi:hypothetical protein
MGMKMKIKMKDEGKEKWRKSLKPQSLLYSKVDGLDNPGELFLITAPSYTRK